MSRADATRLRETALDATRTYAARRDEAGRAARAAEISAGGGRWAAAAAARAEAMRAAVGAQEKLRIWSDAARARAVEVAGELGVMMRAGATKAEIRRKGAEGARMEAEAKLAYAALLMGVIDVALEKQAECALVRRINADAAEAAAKRTRTGARGRGGAGAQRTAGNLSQPKEVDVAADRPSAPTNRATHMCECHKEKNKSKRCSVM